VSKVRRAGKFHGQQIERSNITLTPARQPFKVDIF
jgi:hypothetical protein